MLYYNNTILYNGSSELKLNENISLGPMIQLSP